jgi:hypothetical protein
VSKAGHGTSANTHNAMMFTTGFEVDPGFGTGGLIGVVAVPSC